MWLSLLPFIGTLFTVALLPQRYPVFWRAYGPHILLGWTLLAILNTFTDSGFLTGVHTCCYILFLDYVPFLFMLTAFYVVTGGMHLSLHARPTPFVNISMLIILTLFASILGTTGAAMLGITPLLQLNKGRRYQTHTLLFFIFLVCNIGGGLSAIGDPPLFLGFMKGVPFFWPTHNLWPAVCFLAGCLLCIYTGIELFLFRRESQHNRHLAYDGKRFQLTGKKQFILIALIIFTLLGSALLPVPTWCRELCKSIILLMIIHVSFRITPPKVRAKQNWTWHPIIEVAWIFLALFLTAHTPIQLLSQADQGPFASFLTLLHTPQGIPSVPAYFWTTGLLSAFLDNAPTYLVFLAMTGQTPHMLIQHAPQLLKAISLGAVCMGGLTYIGNAPNLLVHTLAKEEFGIAMPSFWRYVALASLVLIPLFWISHILFL